MSSSFLQSMGNQIKQFKNLSDLAQAIGRQLVKEKDHLPFLIVQFNLASKPFSILFQHRVNLNVGNHFESLNYIYDKLNDSFTQILIPSDFDATGSFLLIIPKEASKDEVVIDIINNWRALHRIINNFIKETLLEQNLNYGNQISQLIHDIDSLMRLWNDPASEPQRVAKRLQYQENLNQRLLFYVRDLEILKTSVNIRQLIEATITAGNYSFLKNNLSFENISEHDTIEVDVEFFNTAFKEVVDNALTASGNDEQKIKIKVSKHNIDLQFFLKQWLNVTIINEGKTINPDFLPWVKTPYFTTWKEDGHSGFGLSISQKILEAHQGFLEVNSNKNGQTQVSMYWPMKQK